MSGLGGVRVHIKMILTVVLCLTCLNFRGPQLLFE